MGPPQFNWFLEEWSGEANLAASSGDVTLGVDDICLLGQGVLPEFRRHRAVIVGMAVDHCTVGVLEDTGIFTIGQCCPRLAHLALVHSLLRLGRRVVVDVMTGSTTQHLNDNSWHQ